MDPRTQQGSSSWPATLLLTALSLSIGWGIRGNFGHEFGAMIPGALAAMAFVLVSRRDDWWRRAAPFAMFGALGWSFGGSMSYMQVVAYTHSGDSPSVLYGFACLFVIGFLWAALGGAGTALPACADRTMLTELVSSMSAVFAAWWAEAVWLEPWLVRHGYSLHWFDTDWLGALVAGVVAVGICLVRRRVDRATGLIVALAGGWWISFLGLVVLLGIRMTPPRGDNWAGCLGMTVALLIYCRWARLPGMALAALVSGFIGGIGFAAASMLKLVEVTSGYDTNWHSILEQTTGLFNGLGIAVAMQLLVGRAPRLDDDPPRGRWTDAYATAFVLLVITYLNLRKNPQNWVRDHVIPALLYGVPAGTWFNLAYGLLACGVILLLARHLRRPLPIVPASWLGKGQLLYVVFLWWMVVGNFERALPGFASQRLVTEGVIHVNAVVCTCLLLLWSPKVASYLEPRAVPSSKRSIQLAVAVGIVGALISIFVDRGVVRAVYGDRFAGYARLHIRFGPRATIHQRE